MSAHPEVVSAPEPDRSEAERFISALCGSADVPVTFQTFHDLTKGKLARILHGTLAEHWAELCGLNAQGAGVFLMVNAGDLKGRSNKSVTALRALFIDDDSGGLGLEQLPLAPSLAVQSKHGLHAYWLLKPGESLDRFTPAQTALAQRFKTDRAIKEPSRVMRVPGFLHVKDPAEPFLVRVRAAEEDPATYSVDEVLNGCGAKVAQVVAAPPDDTAAEVKINDSDPEVLKRAVAHLSTIPGGTQGDKGSKPTFFAAMSLVRGFSLSDDAALALLKKHYNPRCDPPWSDKLLRHKIANARKVGRMALGVLLTPQGWQDTANGKRLAYRHGHDLRHCHPLKIWFIWDGKRWAPDESGQVMRLAKETAQSIADEARGADEETAAKLRKWTTQSLMAARLMAMIDLAKSELPVKPYELDRNPWLLNVENGTIDLQTGKIRDHERSDLLTKIAPFSYDPEATCPLWEEFLAKVQPDKAVRGFLQRLLGYALTGDVAEEIFTIVQGDGQRGKSTLLNTIQAVLGEYAVTPQPGIVLSGDKHADPERATPELMKLRGARLATAYETAAGVTLDDAKVKRAASTDTIAARGLHQASIEFMPTHKLILVTNHKPRVVATDYGTWRRVCLIPFDVTISEEEKDIHFKERLRAEYPGILAWMVRGCALWRKEGKLVIPEVLQKFREEYRQGEDVLGQFVAERLIVSAEVSAPKGAVYGDYQQWASNNGINSALTKPSFSRRMADLKGVTSKHSKTGDWWSGLALKYAVKGQAEAARIAEVEGTEAPQPAMRKARARRSDKGRETR